ncbi:MAG: glycosyltransferase family 4 protein [SAR324 cluster bacterium]|nr:glycosyltransferase family 4 protein [SAR324 cluster bacterium]
MNILIGSNVHWWNAEAAYAAVTAELLQQHGHRVWILTRPNTANAIELKKRNLSILTHIELNTINPFRLIQSYYQLKYFIQDHDIDVVNPHRSEGLFLYVLLLWRLRSFRLIRTRGTTRRVRANWLNNKLHQEWIHAHVVAGQVIAQRLLDSVPVSPEKVHVIYYPSRQPRLPVCSTPSQYNHEFGISSEAIILGIVGRLSPLKGHSLLFQALKFLLSRYPKLILAVIYKHPDNHPRLVALKLEAKASGVSDAIRWIGLRDDILALMEWVNLGIVSSIDSEVICRVAVEFFSVGTPVVAFPTGCLPELIQHGTTGYLAKNHTPEALADVIEEAISGAVPLATLGRNARNVAETNLHPNIFLKKTLTVFE